MANKFKVGDKVRCISGKSDNRYAGAGWQKGLEFTITNVDDCYFGGLNANGVYEKFLELVKKDEATASQFKIGDKVRVLDKYGHCSCHSLPWEIHGDYPPERNPKGIINGVSGNFCSVKLPTGKARNRGETLTLHYHEKYLELPSYVGRYLKALVSSPQDISSMSKGDCLKITSKGRGTYGRVNWNWDEKKIGKIWELMPEGFSPNITEEVSQKGEIGSSQNASQYKFNKGDLVVVHDGFGGWIEAGEIVKLGGNRWNNHDHPIDREKMDNCEGIVAISKQFPRGESGGFHFTTISSFRHATEEEVKYYYEVGIGANINQMLQTTEGNDVSLEEPEDLGIVPMQRIL